jgi:lipopolysaccharide/colanic/teichoic acid biosynthesis glycosyltransferase
MLKRIFNIFFSSLGLVILSPFFLIMAIWIKLDSNGPVFFRGLRVGLHGKPFCIFKFRSMVVDADNIGAASTSKNDFRLTKVGMFIRKYKLDEFSQLINVFWGDMSLVGPRPEVQKFVDQYTEEEKKILTVRPGITDFASIKFHNEGEIIENSGIIDADEAYMKLIRPEKLRLQMKYVEEQNMFLDVKLILQTIKRVLPK